MYFVFSKMEGIMKKTVEDIQNELIDSIGETSERFGMTRVAGLLEGLLILAREPLSLDEMAERLEVSKASVSTNIRVLERWKAVRRVFNRGDRKNYYELRGDLWEIETDIIKTILKEELESCATNVARWKRDLVEADEGDPEERAHLKKRLDELQDYLDAAEHLMQLFIREGKVTPAVIRKIEIR